jgi:hypothetical protein
MNCRAIKIIGGQESIVGQSRWSANGKLKPAMPASSARDGPVQKVSRAALKDG